MPHSSPDLSTFLVAFFRRLLGVGNCQLLCPYFDATHRRNRLHLSVTSCTVMSSLRNSLHRRNHKVRTQLSRRQRFGILEKHKDYVLRARDYHSKQDRIQRLRRKAADRNKDEFYFWMNKQGTQVFEHCVSYSSIYADIRFTIRNAYIYKIGGILAFRWTW